MIPSSASLTLCLHSLSRYRGFAAAVLGYLLLLGAAARLPGAAAHRELLFMLAIPLAFSSVFLIAAAAFPEGDVLGPGSSFPPHLLILPVSTGRLVLWPLLSGMAIAALCWVAPALLVLRPLGVQAPLLWPACLLCAMAAALQAILWWSPGVPYVRAVTAAVVLPVMVSAGVIADASGVPAVALAAAYLGAAAAASAAATRALALSRRGEVPAWRSPRLRPSSRVARGSAPFASALRAQLWLEWRAHGLTLPAFTGLVLALLSVPFLWVADRVPLEPNPPRSEFGNIQVNLWLSLLFSSLLWPPLLAAIIGCGRRKWDTRRHELSLHPLIAARPLETGRFIAARLWIAAGSTALAWLIALAVFSAWLLLPAVDRGETAPLALLMARYGDARTGLLLCLLVAALVFWTWKNLVQGLFADVSGKPALVYGTPLLAHSLTVAAFLWVVNSLGQAREVDPQYAALPQELPWLLGAGLALKLALAAWAGCRLRREELLSRRALLLAGGAWIVVVVALGAGLTWIAENAEWSRPAAFFTGVYAPFLTGAAPSGLRTPPYLFTLAALFVPLARLLLAPLTLAANRSR